jgi:DNA-binding LacI/PurR family transcriptional regulator
MVDPPLTTIDQPVAQIGYQSCELLIEKINNSMMSPKKIFLDTELVVRESTRTIDAFRESVS